jgi:hypothetical protein
MSDRTDAARSHADVTTVRPDRYAKQLVSHLGRRNGGQWTAETRSGWIDLGDGRASVTAADGVLELEIVAPETALPRLEDVVGSHLVRFGDRDELAVHWVRNSAADSGHDDNPTKE